MARMFARHQVADYDAWRKVYVIGAVVSLYLNCFVLVVQAFLKVPALHALAPQGKEPPFVLAQGGRDAPGLDDLDLGFAFRHRQAFRTRLQCLIGGSVGDVQAGNEGVRRRKLQVEPEHAEGDPWPRAQVRQADQENGRTDRLFGCGEAMDRHYPSHLLRWSAAEIAPGRRPERPWFL